MAMAYIVCGVMYDDDTTMCDCDYTGDRRSSDLAVVFDLAEAVAHAGESQPEKCYVAGGRSCDDGEAASIEDRIM